MRRNPEVFQREYEQESKYCLLKFFAIERDYHEFFWTNEHKSGLECYQTVEL